MMTCEIDRGSSVTVLHLDGEIRLGTVGQVRTSLIKCMAECPAAVVVDLTGVTIQAPVALTVFGAVVRRTAVWPPVPLALVASDPEMRILVGRACRPWQIPVRASLPEALSLATAATSPVRRVQRTLRPTTTALASGRAMVGTACAEWGLTHHALAAELIITELVGNAVEHARTDLVVSAVLRRGLLHLTVSDRCPDPPRLNSVPPAGAARGRGLLLVKEFSTAWGYLPANGGKVVWATVTV